MFITRTSLSVDTAALAAGDAARVLCAQRADPASRDGEGKTPEDLACEADSEAPDRAWTDSGPGELAGWLARGGGCATLAARAGRGRPVAADEVNAVWRSYVCARRSDLTG